MSTALTPPVQEQVDDTAVLPLDISGFDALEFPLKVAAAHFAHAAKAGDRIAFEQGSRFHLPILGLLEDLVGARPVLHGDLLERITLFLKQMWLHRGNHHVESSLKFLPPFTASELKRALKTAGHDLGSHLAPGMRQKDLERALFDDDFEPQVTCKSPPPGQDVVTASSVACYMGVTAVDVARSPGDHPLNSSLVRRRGRIEEHVWRAGGDGLAPGRFAGALREVVAGLEAALTWLGPQQVAYLTALTRYLRTGASHDFDAYNRAWVHAETPIDVIIGFIETYSDPLGLRGQFEGSVHMPDHSGVALMQVLAREAAYFEARMPWDTAWSRSRVEVQQAYVSSLITLTGSAGPFGYAGVNLPNANHLRESIGTRSFLVANVRRQRRSVEGDAYLRELCGSSGEMERARAWGADAMDLIVALHEVIGHASGQVSPELVGSPEDHLREFGNTLEELRADLVAMYHIFDPRLAELGLVRDAAVPVEAMWQMLRSVPIMITKLAKPVAEEDHDRGDLLFFHYLLEREAGIRVETRDGKSDFVVFDPLAMRQGVGELLAHVMRIKATGDYEGARALVERYGVRVDAALHREMKARAAKFGVPARVAFINPRLEVVRDGEGRAVDVVVGWPRDFADEQLELSALYRRLSA